LVGGFGPWPGRFVDLPIANSMRLKTNISLRAQAGAGLWVKLQLVVARCRVR
jgi:hypothetical protein